MTSLQSPAFLDHQQLNFVQHIQPKLKTTGRAAVVVPDNRSCLRAVLGNTSARPRWPPENRPCVATSKPANEDERINLAQIQRQLRTTLQVAAYEVVFGRACFQGHGAGVLGGGDAILLGHREHAQNAAHGDFPMVTMQVLAEGADVPARLFTPGEE